MLCKLQMGSAFLRQVLSMQQCVLTEMTPEEPFNLPVWMPFNHTAYDL